MVDEDMDVKRLAHSLMTRQRLASIAGETVLVRKLAKELTLLNYTGVAPGVPGAMIGHCGQWQRVVRTPTRCAQCGAILLQLT